MIFHSGILALLVGSGLTLIVLIGAAWEGLHIIRFWDIKNGSERQLRLERRTYLISLAMSYVLGFQILSLFLYIYTADALSSQFIGAMCAAGSLKVNGYGYPALTVKIASVILAGLWLIVNVIDNRAHDYPLIKIKYILLLFLAPVLCLESILQGMYFLGLKPNIITSCCGLLFSSDANTVISNLFTIPSVLSQSAFLVSTIVVLISGGYTYYRAKGVVFFSIASLLHYFINMLAVVSFISIYIYELPTHHCPFCILHSEYGYIGYFLYAGILVSAILGIGAGVIQCFREVPSLIPIIPQIQKRMVLTAVMANLAVIAVVGYSLFFSQLSFSFS